MDFNFVSCNAPNYLHFNGSQYYGTAQWHFTQLRVGQNTCKQPFFRPRQSTSVAFRINDCPYKLIRDFSACFVLTHTKGIHPIISPNQACLTVELLNDMLSKSKCILLV
ncbi:hypothetical protein AAZX31_18G141700 [Glycine max]